MFIQAIIYEVVPMKIFKPPSEYDLSSPLQAICWIWRFRPVYLLEIEEVPRENAEAFGNRTYAENFPWLLEANSSPIRENKHKESNYIQCVKQPWVKKKRTLMVFGFVSLKCGFCGFLRMILLLELVVVPWWDCGGGRRERRDRVEEEDKGKKKKKIWVNFNVVCWC